MPTHAVFRALPEAQDELLSRLDELLSRLDDARAGQPRELVRDTVARRTGSDPAGCLLPDRVGRVPPAGQRLLRGPKASRSGRSGGPLRRHGRRLTGRAP